MITDFHAHAFPDSLAERAMRALLAETTDVRAYHDGKLSSLLASMDRAGIGRAVLCNIATRPEQFDKIADWCAAIASDRIVPLPSVHPADPQAAARVAELSRRGFKGLKLHPYYQDYFIDEPRLFPVYEAAQRAGMFVISHTGFDVAFPRVRRADPVRIARVVRELPALRFVATHLGAWSDWDEVERHLLGRPIYMELSYSLGELGRERARELIGRHPREYMLFGTDSPWQDQGDTLSRLRELKLGSAAEEAILGGNAERLLGACTA